MNVRFKKGCLMVKRSRKREKRKYGKIKIWKVMGFYDIIIFILGIYIYKRNEYICLLKDVYYIGMFIYCCFRLGIF